MAETIAENLGAGQLAGVSAEAAAVEKPELPAFLQGDELPEGYEQVELGPNASQLINIGLEPGNEVVCYAGNAGVILARGEDEKIYFRLKGLDFPPVDEGFNRVSNIGPEGIPLEDKLERIYLIKRKLRPFSLSGSGDMSVSRHERHIFIRLPHEVEVDDTRIEISDMGFRGACFQLDGGNARITNVNSSSFFRVVRPSAVREGEAGAEKATEPEAAVAAAVVSSEWVAEPAAVETGAVEGAGPQPDEVSAGGLQLSDKELFAGEFDEQLARAATPQDVLRVVEHQVEGLGSDVFSRGTRVAELTGQRGKLEEELQAAEPEAAVAAARREGIARKARAEARRGVEEKKAWQGAAGEMARDTFARIGFERSGGNEIVGAAAFEFRTEIADKTMGMEMFTEMMSELNGIAKHYETQLGRPPEQKLPWPQVVDDMGGDNIAKTAFERTGSRIAAAAAYRFRQGILKSQDEGAGFKEMMTKINEAVGKHSSQIGGRKAVLPN